MQSSVVRSGFLFFRLSINEKKPSEKSYVVLNNGRQQCRPCLEVYKDARQYIAKNCIHVILDLDVRMAMQWQGKEAWELHSFQIVTIEGTCVFSPGDKEELDAWLWDVRGSLMHSPSFKKSTRMPLQGNLLYGSCEKYQPTFLVMPDSLTSSRLQVSGSVLLVFLSEGFAVTSVDGRLIASFHLGVIRRFGYSLRNFKFWTGRACVLGEGLFVFLTEQGNEIVYYIKQTKEVLKNGIISPTETKSPKSDTTEHIYEEPTYMRLPFFDGQRPSSLSPPVPEAPSMATGTKAPARGGSPLLREHEWQIKTMMVLEFAKEFCNGDSRRYCEILNKFLERQGLTPFVWDC
ncbi:docking protein 2-like [Penaeus chinensis]|uniref:docking protein 2-like n=1 Tax=Penaeus chinensis TaxID=139456 RepID=UPI001FB67281|nr:docking protein 2-like [Penaeus chinensis]